MISFINLVLKYVNLVELAQQVVCKPLLSKDIELLKFISGHILEAEPLDIL